MQDVAIRNGNVYGNGVYLAEYPCLAGKYVESRMEDGGRRRMLVCVVLLGDGVVWASHRDGTVSDGTLFVASDATYVLPVAILHFNIEVTARKAAEEVRRSTLEDFGPYFYG